jgi:hypothetical protein
MPKLTGTVVASGATAEDAYVQIQNLAGDFQAEVRTDAAGQFVLYPCPRALAAGVLAAGRWESGARGRGGSPGLGRRGRTGRPDESSRVAEPESDDGSECLPVLNHRRQRAGR